MSPTELSVFLIGLNVALAWLLAMQGFILLAISIYFEPRFETASTETRTAADHPRRYYSAFLLFWTIAWTAALFDWIETFYENQWGHPPWLIWTVDTMAAFFFGAAAYVLFRGARFDWNDRYLKTAYALLPAAILLGVVPLLLVNRDNLFVKLLYNSVDLILFMAVIFAVAIAIFRELSGTAGRVRWTILAVFLAIGLLQIPNSFVAAIDEIQKTSDSIPREVIRTLFAVGKIALFFAIIATLVSFYRTTLTVKFVKSARMTSLILGTACSVFLAFYALRRVIQAVAG